MDSSKIGKLHQQATCYVYVLWLRDVVLKVPTASLRTQAHFPAPASHRVDGVVLCMSRSPCTSHSGLNTVPSLRPSPPGDALRGGRGSRARRSFDLENCGAQLGTFSGNQGVMALDPFCLLAFRSEAYQIPFPNFAFEAQKTSRFHIEQNPKNPPPDRQ